MNYTFPTRNEARALLKAISYENNNLSLDYMTKNLILLYKNNGVEYATFVFTNALTDMYSNANVNTENSIDSLIQGGFNLQTPEAFFKNEVGLSIEQIINQYEKHNSDYIVEFISDNNSEFDLSWFNNSDNYIHPLLAAYQKLKQSKGMLFQKADIEQIPIDYSVVLCYNHYKQKGFITKEIVSLIIEKLVFAANSCINTITIDTNNTEYNVIKNLKSPSEIRVAFDFIKQF